MELSDIFDSEALEYCSQMADHITPEQDSDDSLDELMLTTCHWEPPTTTEVADQEYEAAEPATTAEPDTDSTPTMRACTRRAGNQPHPSRAPASRFATPVTDDEVLQRKQHKTPNIAPSMAGVEQQSQPEPQQ